MMFDEVAFAGQQLILQMHESLRQVAPGLGKKLNTVVLKQLRGQRLGNISVVSKDFAKGSL